MDSQEIVDYVMETPGNTNPAILKQMIDGVSSSGGAFDLLAVIDYTKDKAVTLAANYDDVKNKILNKDVVTTCVIAYDVNSVANYYAPDELYYDDSAITLHVSGGYELCLYPDGSAAWYDLG